jgi:hypothetical protein
MPFAIERYRRLYPRVELQLQELATADQMRFEGKGPRFGLSARRRGGKRD